MAAAPGLISVMADVDLHTWNFCIMPTQWGIYQNKHAWTEVDLKPGNSGSIPATWGIYSLILKPQIADHPTCYMLYIGYTNSLQRRFREYLGVEKKKARRPHIFKFLNIYDGYVIFSYTPHPRRNCNRNEKALINSFLPPLNKDDIEGDIGKARKAKL